MSDTNSLSKSACALNRRQFLGGCAACAAGLAGISALGAKSVMANQTIDIPSEKAKVRLVFTHKSPERAGWPYLGYDYEGRKKELTEKLRRACPAIEFLPATVQNTKDAGRILEADKEKDIDGYLVYILGTATNKASRIIVGYSKRPIIIVDDLYGGTGTFLPTYAAVKQKRLRVTGVSSSLFEDVVQAVRCFECMKKLRSSVIIEVGAGRGYGLGLPYDLVQDSIGAKVVPIGHTELDKAYEQADHKETCKWADRWIREAEKVVEPSRQDIEKSAAMYLAMCSLMAKYKAQAITINCLGGFYRGKMKAYPCLGFFQFNNDGLVGACEADMRSTITMLLMTYLVGRPGYISDPVIDTANNQIIYAHCVATNKVFGPDGPTNPYHIRSHSEDRKGASIRSILPLGEMTTTIMFDPKKKQVIFHQGKTVANIDEDKACRTKLAVEVKGDIDKLFNYWHLWGWHRVTFYGDLKAPVYHIARLLGFEVVQEA